MALESGETFINGRSRDTARRLLDAAAVVGLDPSIVVRTTSHGYIVPDAVADAVTAPDPAEAF